MREYSYRCHDFSLLTPTFKKWWVAPLLQFVPWAVPANIITLVSNLFVYLGFFIAYHYDSPLSRLIIAACLLIYLIGDHLDGMQAKKTGTGSALGEFCDHYLDAFNNGLILFTAFLVFDISDPTLVSVTLATSYLAHTAVFYEQFKTGWLTFEKLGSLEAVLLISAVIGFAALSPVYLFFTTEVFSSYRIIEIVFAFSAIGAVSTFVTTIIRTPDKRNPLWLFVLGLVIVTFLASTSLSIFQSFVLITLYSSLYVGLVMKAHLVDGIERIPDFVIPATLLFVQFITPGDFNFAFQILSIYLGVRIGLLVYQTFSTLKIFWVWANPRTSSK